MDFMIKNSILGYSISPYLEISSKNINEKTIINTINPHCYCEAKKDSLYSQALHQSDKLLPDGIGIVWAFRVLTGQKIKRVSGSDLHISLLQKMNDISGKVFYVGSTSDTLQKIRKRVNIEFPNIIIGTFSPPYETIFTAKEDAQILSAINEFAPNVLFVGMTAPKQEKWVYQHKDQIDAKVIASIGAVFDFYAGTIKRSGKFWIKLGLEWLPRFLREPKRLWRRNFISTPLFIWDVLHAKLISNK